MARGAEVTHERVKAVEDTGDMAELAEEKPQAVGSSGDIMPPLAYPHPPHPSANRPEA